MNRTAVLALVLGAAVGLGVGFLIWGNPRYEIRTGGEVPALYIFDSQTGDVWYSAMGSRPKLVGTVPDRRPTALEVVAERLRKEREAAQERQGTSHDDR